MQKINNERWIPMKEFIKWEYSEIGSVIIVNLKSEDELSLQTECQQPRITQRTKSNQQINWKRSKSLWW